MNHKNRVAISVIFIILLLALFIGLEHYFNLELLEFYKNEILTYVKQNYFISSVLFIFIHSLSTIFLSFFSFPLTIFGGFLFGAIPATIFSVLASTIASVIVFIYFEYLWKGYIHKRFEKQLRNFNKHIEKQGVWYLLILRLLPITPFLIVSILASVSKIDLFSFTWATAVGILPVTFIYSYAGSKLEKLTDFNGYFNIIVLISFILILFIYIWRFLKIRLKNEK